MAASTPALRLSSTAAVLKNTSQRKASPQLSFLQRGFQRHSQKLQNQKTRGVCRAYKVEVEHKGKVHTLEVEDGETILEKALEADLDVPYDCKLGVCMTCPAKLVSGSVDQSGSMLSDDVIEKGYALLCMAVPQSDCHFRTIPEEELLQLQLVTAQH
ncbi:hypothetical protein GOP47_0013376 [Adiantum capillus-veneris]|uniref:2Fe-2S ferredoxin-type domain-containing protein n=1 Tax=Adiantum capillus-veneris TaxID=13818 RepID=A0A9D4ZF87_ADICA|nr:hypothetical protein GOP47_0013376 [Adiantum capillus-veneris]